MYLCAPLTMSFLLPRSLSMRTREAAAGLLYLGVTICSPVTGTARTTRLHRSRGPHGQGLIGGSLLGLEVCNHPLGHLPGMVLSLLAVLVIIRTCSCILLPVERTRTVRSNSLRWSL